MLRRILPVPLLAGAAVALARCDLVAPAPGVDVTRLAFRLELEAEEVAAGDTVDAEALIVNTGVDNATITTSAACFGVLSVKDDGKDRDFRSVPDACWTVASPVTIEPGDTLGYRWSIETAGSTGAPFPPGEYQVYVHLDGRLDGGSNIPDIARTLVVR